MARERAESVALTEAAFRIANERMARWEERQTDDRPLETEIESHPGYTVIEKPVVLQALLDEADPRSTASGPAGDEASRLADEITGTTD